MERKKIQRIAVTIAIIGVLFMFGTGTKKAEAYMPNTLIECIYATFYQSTAGIMYGLGFYYNDYSYFYNEYQYMDAAAASAYNAAYYASYSSNYYAYNAYSYAMDAYYNLDTATGLAYDCWYYYDGYSGDLSAYYGGLAGQSLAYLTFYAGYL